MHTQRVTNTAPALIAQIDPAEYARYMARRASVIASGGRIDEALTGYDAATQMWVVIQASDD